ncbi:MAG: flagellar motor protein MotB [Gammaproteobacteria bacterium]|nr:flagellar motor protein MotB [Gammaproteobacteria bacterium]
MIIVKRPKRGGGGHHGGAWKVAYADFVTAMMAFFMVMWLVTAVNKEKRAAIFEYFKNPSMQEGKSPKPVPGQMGPGGASTSVIDLQGGMDAPKSRIMQNQGFGALQEARPTSIEEARKLADAAERRKLESLLEDLKKAIENSQALKPFKDQLLLDITPEGLRIQIVDAQNRPMFDLGSSHLKSYTALILKELAAYLNTVPNRLSLSGHTDTTPYVAQNGYTNWDLSADRANAARRALEAGGLHADKVARVVGLSSAVLFDKANPRNPINRRISIIVMTREAEAAALKTDTPVPPAGGVVSAASAAADAAVATPAPGVPAMPPPRATQTATAATAAGAQTLVKAAAEAANAGGSAAPAAH